MIVIKDAWHHFRCWFLFRHKMESLGYLNERKFELWQCRICAKTISVVQGNMNWV